MERKHIVFLTVLSVATLLVAVVGATFAYFTTQVNRDAFTGVGASDANKASVSTAVLSESTILFRPKAGVAGNKIQLDNAIPGDWDSAVFEIVNSGEVDISYNVVWKDVVSNFNSSEGTFAGLTPHPEELQYYLKCTGGTDASTDFSNELNPETCPYTSAGETMNGSDSIIVKKRHTAECTVRVDFIETGDNQDYNQGRSFSATIDINTGTVGSE